MKKYQYDYLTIEIECFETGFREISNKIEKLGFIFEMKLKLLHSTDQSIENYIV